jgi:O-antigen ligase
MFALPGTLAVLIIIFIRPHEVYPVLQSVPWLHVFFGLSLLGLVVDLKLRLLRPQVTPQLIWVVLLLLWCLVTLLVRAPSKLLTEGSELAILLALFLLVATSVQSFSSFHRLAQCLVLISLFLSVVAIQQRFSPFTCVKQDTWNSDQAGQPDGRPCETRAECITNGEPGKYYVCEKVGLMGTTTVGKGRVRYRGVLQDSNDLALALSVFFTFAVGLYSARRSRKDLVLLLVAFAAVASTVLLTKSRGGLLAFMVILGVYFIRRYKLRGLLATVAAAIPLFLATSSSRLDSESSSLERMECWYEGMSMVRETKLFGVGLRQFTEHHYLTAHNAYVLVSAELGLIGTFLWLGLIYISLKIPIQALRDFRDRPEAAIAARWSMSLLAGMIGMLVGIFFLSFSYHHVLWTYIGTCGSLYSSIRAHASGWKVRFRLSDFALLTAITFFLIGGLYVLTRLQA